jgi:predicted neuraminidase
VLKHTVVSTKGSRAWQGIPGIEREPDGRLWVVFFSGGPQEPHEDNCILITTSTDDGDSWSDPRVIIERPGARRCFDPALWHDPQGRLWLFYNEAHLGEGEHSLWTITAAGSPRSDAAWSVPRRIEVDAPYAFRLNKPTVLRDGRWLLPVTWARTRPGRWFAQDQLQGVAISDDVGVTWRLRGAVESPAWALENMLVERNDGSVWMLIRTGAGVIWQSHSTDGGETWSPGQPTNIANPGSRFFVRSLNSGQLLLINTPRPNERTSLYAYLSADEGRSFGGGALLDEREKVSYPDAVEAPGGIIHMVHDCDRHGTGEIMYRSFPVSDIPAPERPS